MSEAADAPEGLVIEGRYRIVRKIAEGGMATVYQAVDDRLDRTVALKIMHTQLAQGPHREQFVERFHREAKSAAAIANPHVVQVYDTGEYRGLDYLVMEYVHGVNLRHEMNVQHTFTVRETLRIVNEMLDGLSAAHRLGVVHRDIKPENILLNDRGHVQITDFGLARAASQATLSSTGMLLGTAAYLAPEMIENNQATPQGDLYAVGITAWEMLVGDVPFMSDNPVTLVFKHVHEDVPSLLDQCPGIDSSVAQFVARLTARAVDERPADASVALAELRRISATLPIASWQYRKPDDAGTAADDAADSPIGKVAAAAAVAGASAAAAGTAGDAASATPPAPSTPIPAPPIDAPEQSSADAGDASNAHPDGVPAPPRPPAPAHTQQTRQAHTTPQPAPDIQHAETATNAGTPSNADAAQTSILNASATTIMPSVPADDDSATGRIPAADGTSELTQVIGTADTAPSADTPPSHANDTGERDGRRRRKSRKPWIIAAVIIVLLIAGAGGGLAWWYYYGPGSYWTMPQPDDITCEEDVACPITDADWDDYESSLIVAGIPYTVEEDYSDTIAEGDIIATDPENVGDRVSKRGGESVTVTVSLGVRQATIPDDILDPDSENGRDPLTALSDAGFDNVTHDEDNDEYSMTVPAGAAMTISPDPGTTMDHDAEVVVTLSLGPKPVEMPNVVGSGLDDAQSELEDLNLTVNVTEDYSDSVDEGYVISASANAGDELYWGDTVNLVVSRGPETATVPGDLVGQSEEDVTAELEDLGFDVEVDYVLGGLFGTVRDVQYDGESISDGATVRLRDTNGNPTVITLTVV